MTGPQVTATKRNIIQLALAVIHPDPYQPRLHPDAELEGSIRSQGLLVPFTVEKLPALDVDCPDCKRSFLELEEEGGHYMISDGERRWRGSKAAGLKTVDVELLPSTTEGERLLRQLTSNTGKPLSAVEEAYAYEGAMRSFGWNQARLAKELGVAKSVVGDRIRLISLDEVWLELIVAGKLQVSHGPILATYSAVPAEYQKKAAKAMQESYQFTHAIEDGDGITVDAMKDLAYTCFRDFIKPMKDVPGYRGPTVTPTARHSWDSRHQKYAADIKIWRPIFNKRQNKRRKEMQSNAGSGQRIRKDDTIQKLEDLPKRKSSEYHAKGHKGEVIVYVGESGWSDDLAGTPEIFLSKVDPTKLTRVFANYNAAIVTSDLEAIAAARADFNEKLRKQLADKLSAIRLYLVGAGKATTAKYRVEGPGCKSILSGLERWQSPIPAIAFALGIKSEGLGDEEDDDPVDGKINPLDLKDEDAAILLTGYAATKANVFKVPNLADVRRQLLNKSRRTPFKLPVAGAPPSKNAQKKADRKAGKQVGDPTRRRALANGDLVTPSPELNKVLEAAG